MNRAFNFGGALLLGAGSFLIGRYSTDFDSLRKLQAATAVSPNVPITVPLSSTPPMSPTDKLPDLPPSRASQVMKFGYPGFDNLRTFEDFVLSYDRKTRTAHWVCEHLTPDRMVYVPDIDRSKCDFRPDESIHAYFRSQNEDYRGSGYDRGHLAAAGNHRRSQNSINQTFFLTNMSPQVGKGFNRDKWNDVEKYARKGLLTREVRKSEITDTDETFQIGVFNDGADDAEVKKKLAKKHLNTYILTGPLYLARKEADGHMYVRYKVIGKSQVAVPTHFFKVILYETSPNNFELEAFLLPNEVIPDETPIEKFHVPLDAIERAAGFLIFDKIPKGALKKVNGKSVGGFW
ncbi:hypothetical protein WR25_12339 [Diploscapter pachys]|uniref:Endonuclease n=1 Tax=Diploscapter pachys TaxID=2018661 RepID=A0A2A2LBA1_9BILA|nr:hypothetical protein WR25_12339 [Diploscapter pachys]